MKQIVAALLACLLLCGCGREPAAQIPSTEAPVTTAATEPTGFYVPGSSLEQQYHGAVRVYPLQLQMASGLRAFAGGLLVFSGEEKTTLTLLAGEDLYIRATVQLDFLLDPQDPSLVFGGTELSYYDPAAGATVVLDQKLQPVSRIAAPEGLTGTPVLTADRNTLYYCTANSLRAWDPESGIRRTLKEMSYPGQTVAGVHFGGKVIHCRTEDSHMLLSAADGRLLEEHTGPLTLQSSEDAFSASLDLGLNPMLVYTSAGRPRMLLPEDFTGEYFCLEPGRSALRVVPREQALSCEYYDLTTGLRSSVLTLTPEQMPLSVAEGADGFVYLLAEDAEYGCSAVYRWDTQALATNDPTGYSASYLDPAYPLPREQERCREYAAELSQRFGIQILIGQEACKTQPWDYDLEPETQPALILRELALLEERLSQYPEGFLAETASDFTALKLCLVRSVTGSAESGSLHAATGVQFFEGSDAHVAITVGKYAQQALYHELFHVMETHILNNSIAFDQWDALNPSGFTYDYGYAANQSRDSGVYLQWEHRAFVDTYSMSFPKEDRARIMEYAMLPGNQELFEAPALQAKLQALCSGIREAYGLKKSEETFLWEQYLTD